MTSSHACLLPARSGHHHALPSLLVILLLSPSLHSKTRKNNQLHKFIPSVRREKNHHTYKDLYDLANDMSDLSVSSIKNLTGLITSLSFSSLSLLPTLYTAARTYQQYAYLGRVVSPVNCCSQTFILFQVNSWP